MNLIKSNKTCKLVLRQQCKFTQVCLSFLQQRFISKKKQLEGSQTNIKNATDYYDKVYSKVYGADWKNIKESLSRPNKYFAVINNCNDYHPLITKLEETGAFEVGAFYNNNINKDKGKELNEFASKQCLQLSSNIEKDAKNDTSTQLTTGANRGSDGSINSPRKLNEASLENFENYVPSNRYRGLEKWIEEEDDVFIDDRDQEVGVKKLLLKDPLPWPGILKTYCYILGDHTDFPEPCAWKTNGFYSHYLLNGSSMLPVLALDLKPSDRVLDMCASPGEKSFMILQTGHLDYLECSDVSESQTNQISDMFGQYFPKNSSMRDKFFISQKDGCNSDNCGFFDKILVDAPCLDDRHSVTVNDNSIFESSRSMERTFQSSNQASLIYYAITQVKPGGSVVYSTRTMSPFQNDGAVFQALKDLSHEGYSDYGYSEWEDWSDIECTVIDLSETIKHLRTVFNFGYDLGLRYGHIVLPEINRNFGPLYFCKIVRNK